MDEPRRKAMQSVEVKDGDSGQVEAVFATLGVIDHDGDVLTKGAFTDGAPVVISAYGHGSHMGALPIGKGRIVMSDTEARMVGQFFMDTSHGRDAFHTVKNLSGDDSLQEWSFSLRDIESHAEQLDGREANVITRVAVKEVSPVLEGAGIATRTVAAKAGARFVDQAAVVLGDLTALTERAVEVVAMRSDKNKGLSAETVVVLAALQAQADKLKTVVEHSAAVRHMLTPLMAMLAVAELETVAS
jgi:hypothetical protein